MGLEYFPEVSQNYVEIVASEEPEDEDPPIEYRVYLPAKFYT